MNQRANTTRKRFAYLIRALIPAYALLLAALQPWSAPRAAAQADKPYSVFLPLARNAGTTTPPPPPPGGKGSLFLNKAIKNASADVAVDARGGMHAVYAHFIPDADNPRAVYAYCPAPASNCASAAGWQMVSLLEHVSEVQLQLTAAGQPRLLIVSTSTVYNGGKDYWYAACDGGCASAGAWSLTRIVSSWGTSTYDVDEQNRPQRTFALDPQGRPRFLYQDRNYFYAEPDHIGVYYVACDERCDDAGQWTQTEITYELNQPYRFDNEVMDYPALVFDANGGARVVANVFALNPDGSDAPDGLYYYECDSGCDSIDSWQRTFLLPPGSGSVPAPSWDLALDANGHPRIALFTGGGLSPDTFNYQLLYLYCDGGCLDSNQWNFNNVGLGGSNGQSADLELNAQGDPRIAWISSIGDLGYAWCDGACEADPAPWHQRTVETEAAVRQQNPQAIPPHCDSDTWNGIAPTLALDPSGAPRIAYDVAVNARCYYDDTPNNPTDPPTIRFEPIWRGVHLSFFPQP